MSKNLFKNYIDKIEMFLKQTSKLMDLPDRYDHHGDLKIFDHLDLEMRSSQNLKKKTSCGLKSSIYMC